jgi:hypothetical protein
MTIPTLSPQHLITWQAAKLGPMVRAIEALRKEPSKLESYLRESEDLIAAYTVDNVVRHEYLLTRATKV